ncbi:MAG: DEAD/DEAH box helicase, partial [Solibacillus sp.]
QEDAMKNLVNLVQNEDISKYRELAAQLLENNEALDLVAAALKSITKEPDATPISLSEERPLPMRRDRSNGGGRGGSDRGRSSRGGNDRRGGGGGDRRREGGGGGRRDSGRREGGNGGGGRREGSSSSRDRRPRQRRED